MASALLLLLASVVQAQTAPLFSERPGSLELSGRLLVRPLQAASLQGQGRTLRQAAVAHARAVALLEPFRLRLLEEADLHVVRVPRDMNDGAFARRLLATGAFEFVEPDWICFPQKVPDDPSYYLQWHHQTMQSEAAWDFVVGDPCAIAAFVDTGVDLNHGDLAAALVPGYNSVDDLPQSQGGQVDDVQVTGHGTSVAGCIGAIGNNSTHVAGVAWNIGLMPIRASNLFNGGAYLSDILAGALWAVENGARTISVSYTGVQSSSVNTTGNVVRSLGGLLIWAAANDGVDLGNFDWANVVVVGATDSSDVRWSSSNYGTPIDVTAPGVGIWTTKKGGGIVSQTGTSFAAPLVNGVAAMIWAMNPALSPVEVKGILYASCDDLGPVGEDNEYGNGRVNLFKAVTAARDAYPVQETFTANTLDKPRDVAVYAPCGPAGGRKAVPWIFVADPGSHALYQFRESGQLFKKYDATDGPEFDFFTGPFAVAVNDLRGHPNQGQVYVGRLPVRVYQIQTGTGTPFQDLFRLKHVFDFYGEPIPYDVSGLALDHEGNVYLGRSNVIEAHKYSWTDFAFPNPNASAVQTYNLMGANPVDLSVSRSGNLWVTTGNGFLMRYDNGGSLLDLIQPSIPVCGVPAPFGIDAHDLHENPWFSVTTGNTGCTWGVERRREADLTVVDSHPGQGIPRDPRGMEVKRFWRWGPGPLNQKKTICTEKVFVTDTGFGFWAPEVRVFSQETVSAGRPPDCVAWWRFEGQTLSQAFQVHDQMELNNGVFNGTQDPVLETGVVRCSMSFEGNDDTFLVPHNATLDFGTDNMSIEGWLWVAGSGLTGTILDKRFGPTSPGYQLFLASGRLGFHLNAGGANWEDFVPQVPCNFPADQRWHHFAVTLKRKHLKTGEYASTRIYLDGDLAAIDETPILGSISSPADLVVGRLSGGGGDFQGSLDELSIYKRALTQKEVWAIYRAGCAGKNLPGMALQSE
ncbi:MAG: S8 family serine peptidase [Planctomycetota bacterium]